MSDIHIHSYQQFATFDQHGSSSRLKLYLNLAQDIASIAIKENVDSIIIAGDIVHSAVIDSHVAWVTEKFLGILAATNLPIVMTLGQHDCSAKLDSTDYQEIHSVIAPLVADKDNIYLGYQTTTFEINGWTYLVSPWSPNTLKDFQPADIFVGHGSVVGCRDVTGHEYTTGFPKNALWDNFLLSVIGDIHSHQVHQRENRLIVQPGALHSNKVGDGCNNGIVIIDLTKDGVTSHKFIPNREFDNCDLYYDFVRNYTTGNYPYKVRKNTIFDALPEEVVTEKLGESVKPKTLNLIELFQSVATDKGLEHLVPLFEGLYQNTKAMNLAKVPSGATLQNVKAVNFLSIKQFNLPFEEWGELLITGSNGVGKSSGIDCVFFALTGKNTKKLTLDELKYYGTESFGVSVTLKIGENIVEVQRGRNGSTSFMNLVINGANYKSDTVVNTQKYLYEMLGVTEKELMLFSYFSTFEYESFADMSAKPQYEIIAKLAQTEQLDALRDASSANTKEVSKEVDGLKFYLDRLNSDLNTKTDLLASLEALATEEPVDVSVYQKAIEDSSAKLFELNNKKAAIDTLVSEHASTEKVRSLLFNEIANYKNEVTELISKKSKLADGKCYTCGQSYDSKEELAKIASRMAELGKTVPPKVVELEELTRKTKELKEKVAAIAEQKMAIATEISKCKESMQKSNSMITRATKMASEMGKIDNIRESIVEIERSIDEHSIKLLGATEVLRKYRELDGLLARNGEVVTYLFNNTLETVNAKLKALTHLLDFKVKLVFNGELQIKVSGFSNNVTNFNNLSGGERKLVEISLIGAFINAYNTIYNLKSGLLGFTFLDETISYVDARNIDKVKTILSRIESNIVLITHESSLKTEFTHSMVVTKTDELGSQYTLIS